MAILSHFLYCFSFVKTSKLNIFGCYKNGILSIYKNESLEWKRSKAFVSNFPFYDVPTEKTSIKRLNNIDLLPELLFYDELSIEKILKAYKRYARSYRIKTIDSKIHQFN